MKSTRYSCPILMKLEFSRQVFEKYSKTKLYENPSSGSRVVPCGRTDGQLDKQRGMTNLIFAFRNFANAPKNTTNYTRINKMITLTNFIHVDAS